MTGFDIRDSTILLMISGSRAYGLHHAESDVDIKGIAIPPIEYFLGATLQFEQLDEPGALDGFRKDLTKNEEEAVAKSKLEGSVYDIRKFFRLAAEANPNILEILFCREEEIRLQTEFGRELRKNRDIFVSARAKHTFCGYAASQLKRIRTHRRWLLNPPEKQPARAVFNLPERTLIPKDQLAAAWADIRKKIDSWEIDFGTLPEAGKIQIQERIAEVLSELDVTSDKKWQNAARGLGYNENFISLLDRERQYESAHKEWEQYQSWKRNRNPERSKLEMAHGYDTKHAAHLVRLLKMGKELLETGEFHVWRGDLDADEIRAVLQGDWSFDRLVSWADQKNFALTEIYEKAEYVIPKTPDLEKIDALCQDLVARFHELGRN